MVLAGILLEYRDICVLRIDSLRLLLPLCQNTFCNPIKLHFFSSKNLQCYSFLTTHLGEEINLDIAITHSIIHDYLFNGAIVLARSIRYRYYLVIQDTLPIDRNCLNELGSPVWYKSLKNAYRSNRG